MVGAEDENDMKAKEAFPNLVWHSDAEGYYVPVLPRDWTLDSHIWIGNLNGLYVELQKVSAHMIQADYEGEAKRILKEMLQLFANVAYNSEEPCRHAVMVFS